MVQEGLITIEDVKIVKYTHRPLQPLPADLPVANIMTRQITTVPPDTTARQVAELPLGQIFKAVPVVDEKYQVVGIVTDGDLLRNAQMLTRLAIGKGLEAVDLQESPAQRSIEQTE